MIRALILLAACLAGTAHAGPWGLELGLTSAIGAARFAGDPSSPPQDPNSLFSLFTASDTGSAGLGLAGAAGVSFTLTRKRREYVVLELVQDGQTLKYDEDRVFEDGTELKTSTAWNWSGFRPTLLAAYAWPIKMGPAWALAPRLGGGLWYEKITYQQKLQGADGATPTVVDWAGAPQDDWGWIATVGMDWLRLGPGSGPSRIGLDLRWREGHALPEAAAGADKPVRVIDVVLTVPVYLWVL